MDVQMSAIDPSDIDPTCRALKVGLDPRELGGALDLPICVTMSTGEHCLVRIRGRRIQGSRGDLLLGVALDLTNQTENDHRFRESFLQSRLSTWSWDLVRDWIAFDANWAEILGYEVGDKNVYDMVAWDPLAYLDAVARCNAEVRPKACTRGAPTLEFEHRMRHRLGPWISLIAHDLLGAGRATRGWVGRERRPDRDPGVAGPGGGDRR